MAEVKTNFRHRLSNILSLLSPLRYINLDFKLQPTIDYHKIMTKNIEIHESGLGNAITIFYPDNKFEYKIQSIQVMFQADANASNRYIKVSHNSPSDAFYWYARFKTAVTANQARWKTLLPIIPDNLDGGTLSEYNYMSPWTLYPDETIRIEIENGLAGDTFELYICAKITNCGEYP